MKSCPLKSIMITSCKQKLNSCCGCITNSFNSTPKITVTCKIIKGCEKKSNVQKVSLKIVEKIARIIIEIAEIDNCTKSTKSNQSLRYSRLKTDSYKI